MGRTQTETEGRKFRATLDTEHGATGELQYLASV
jgi:hypothetical protein